jgi:hypothetical protein
VFLHYSIVICSRRNIMFDKIQVSNAYVQQQQWQNVTVVEDNGTTTTIDAMSSNDKGIWLLMEGRSQEAMSTFRTALTEVRSMFPSTPNGEDVDQMQGQEEHNEFDGAHIDTDNYFTSKLVVRSVQLASPSLARSSSHDLVPVGGDDAILVMHDRIFQVCLVEESSMTNHWSLFDRQLLASIVTYNMAVVCHRLGITNGFVSENYLSKALQLYKISCHIIHEQLNHEQYCEVDDDDDDSTFIQPNCHSSISLLLMAGYNNMAHISSLLYDIDEMECYLEDLRNVICDCNDEKIYCPSLDSEEYYVFLMNIMMADQTSALIRYAPAA